MAAPSVTINKIFTGEGSPTDDSEHGFVPVDSRKDRSCSDASLRPDVGYLRKTSSMSSGLSVKSPTITPPPGDDSEVVVKHLEHLNLESCVQVQEEPEERTSPASPDKNLVETQRQLLLVALLERVCRDHDPTPLLFQYACRKLVDLGYLDNSDFATEARHLKGELVEAFETLLSEYRQSSFANDKKGRHSPVESGHMVVPSAMKRAASSPVAARGMTMPTVEGLLSGWKDRISEEAASFVPLPHPLSQSISTPTISLDRLLAFNVHRYHNDFNEIERLGRGAFGSAFRVKHRLVGNEYVVKRVRIKNSVVHSKLQHSLARALSEVRALARLDHRNVVKYHGAWLEPVDPNEGRNGQGGLNTSMDESGYSGDSYDFDSDESEGASKDSSSHAEVGVLAEYRQSYLVDLFIQMERCRTRTLQDFIGMPNRIVDYNQNITILRQVLRGLDHIHSKGLCHRDLKPANLFISLEGSTIKIGDFGLAKDLPIVEWPLHQWAKPHRPEHSESDGSTSSDLVVVTNANCRKHEHTRGVGTHVYAAPEQIAGELACAQSDIFSFGIIVLELFYPFGSGMERAQVLTKVREGELPVAFEKMWPALADVIKSCLLKNPLQRPMARALLNEAAFCSGQGRRSSGNLLKDMSKREIQIIDGAADLSRDSTGAASTVSATLTEDSDGSEEGESMYLVVETLRAELADKDKTILELREEIERLRGERTVSMGSSVADGHPVLCSASLGRATPPILEEAEGKPAVRDPKRTPSRPTMESVPDRTERVSM